MVRAMGGEGGRRRERRRAEEPERAPHEEEHALCSTVTQQLALLVELPRRLSARREKLRGGEIAERKKTATSPPRLVRIREGPYRSFAAKYSKARPRRGRGFLAGTAVRPGRGGWGKRAPGREEHELTLSKYLRRNISVHKLVQPELQGAPVEMLPVAVRLKTRTPASATSITYSAGGRLVARTPVRRRVERLPPRVKRKQDYPRAPGLEAAAVVDDARRSHAAAAADVKRLLNLRGSDATVGPSTSRRVTLRRKAWCRPAPAPKSRVGTGGHGADRVAQASRVVSPRPQSTPQP